MNKLPALISAALFSAVIFTFLILVKKRSISGKGLIVFGGAGILLALFRIGIYLILDNRSRNHTMPQNLNWTRLFLMPESFLIAYLPEMNFFIWNIVVAIILAAGSFLWASPLMFVGAKKID